VYRKLINDEGYKMTVVKLKSRNTNLKGFGLSINPLIASTLLLCSLTGCSGAKWSKPGTWFSRDHASSGQVASSKHLPGARKTVPTKTANRTVRPKSGNAGKPDSLHLELYAERVGMEESNFERYVAKGSVMIVECGERKREQPEVEWQQTVMLSDSDRVLLSQLASQLSSSDLMSLPEPEANGSLFDAGSFKLFLTNKPGKVAPLRVATTLDVVSNQRTNPTRKLNSLFARLRGVSEKAPCGNLSFYGVGRKSAVAKG
jgi:hypothetical protein